ncbi:hypothetical protein AJ80_08338 [Polytolypa hystricis UAMH7299]|uniref:histidine kinase n=1 Tax=Polytolypa hystricis (strain UAMH7299) TaxID=1447883 RepID=A0A2B7X9Y9_POLH7|nr:hypothetical protein AJ80_08338 [Polytolypa hystricis UAMH7299]
MRASQVAASLDHMQALMSYWAHSTLIRNAVARHLAGNATEENWADVKEDFKGSFNAKTHEVLVQVLVFPKDILIDTDPLWTFNETNIGYPLGLESGLDRIPELLIKRTASHKSMDQGASSSEILQLPEKPSKEFYQEVLSFDILGPWIVNRNHSVMSVTATIKDPRPGGFTTSRNNTIGFLMAVFDLVDLRTILAGNMGTEDGARSLLVGAAEQNNELPNNIGRNHDEFWKRQELRLILGSEDDPQWLRRTGRDGNKTGAKFLVGDYPAVENALLNISVGENRAGAILSSHNELGEEVSVGYSKITNEGVDWLMLVEIPKYSASVVSKFRKKFMYTMLVVIFVVLALSFPIAHFWVMPLRRLRAATQRTMQPTDPGGRNGALSGLERDAATCQTGNEKENSCLSGAGRYIHNLRSMFKRNTEPGSDPEEQNSRVFRIPSKVPDRKHWIHDELTDLTKTYNEMTEELKVQYEKLEDKVRERTKQLEISKRAAETANESKTLFLANLSHELKTPLNHVLGLSALCMQEKDQNRIRCCLRTIYTSGDLLLNLLTDLLTFSKNEIGHQLTLHETEFLVGDIGAQVVSMFDSQAKAGGIYLHATYHGPHDPLRTISSSPVPDPCDQEIYSQVVKDMRVRGDQYRLLQVLINLVGNGLKFTPNGGSVSIHITCHGEAHDDGDDRSEVQLLDCPLSNPYPIVFRHSTSSITSIIPDGLSARYKMTDPKKAAAADQSNSSETTSTSYTTRKEQHEDSGASSTREGGLISSGEHHQRRPSGGVNQDKVLLFEFGVVDTGPGIPKDQQLKIFEPFVQGELGLNKKYGGTGLGLSICSQIASLMGGTISLTSKPGFGSVFKLRIPLTCIKIQDDSADGSMIPLSPILKDSLSGQTGSCISPISGLPNPFHSDSETTISGAKVDCVTEMLDSDSSHLASDDGAPQSIIPQLSVLTTPTDHVTSQALRDCKRLRVLVAEDNRVNQEIVVRMLNMEGISDVTLANDGNEAAENVRESLRQKRPFHLIFMDVQMPYLDGLQSTRIIRKLGHSRPIVALTAFAEDSNSKDCIVAGMDHFLPKPIRRQALRQALEKYCGDLIISPVSAVATSPEISRSNTDRENCLDLIP